MVQWIRSSMLILGICIVCSLFMNKPAHGICENEKRAIEALEGLVSVERIHSAKFKQQLSIAQTDIKSLNQRLDTYANIERRLQLTTIIGIMVAILMFVFGIILGSKARKDSLKNQKEPSHD